MFRQYLRAVLTVTLLAAVLFAQSACGAGTEKQDEPQKPDSVVISSAELARTYYSLWSQACRMGDTTEASLYESTLFSLFDADICQSKDELDSMLPSHSDESDAEDNAAQKKPGKAQAREYSRALEMLNTKETLYRILSSSSDFPYKYRLMGDYIQLIRRELKMPKLKLAELTKAACTDGQRVP